VASARFVGAIRLAVAAALVSIGLLLIVCSLTTQAASPSPSTCPDGYHWDRMSGVGCVQTNLPPNARYSYTGAAICNDPYIGVTAPGPNQYGSDPNASYLVECITQQEYERRAAVPKERDGTLSDSDFASAGIVDDLAKLLADEGAVPPGPEDADLGGVTATGVLLLSLGGAVLVGSPGGLGGLGGSPAGGAPGGAGGVGGAGGAAGAAAGAGMAATSGVAAGAGSLISALPADKSQLLLLGLSIFRSIRRVTSEPDPDSLNAGDVAQLMGDAAGIAALASALAPAVGVIALASGGIAAAVETRSPRDVVEQLRRNLGRLGYMQGLVDERVSEKEGRLVERAELSPAPAPPSKLTSTSARDLQTGRAIWALRSDAVLDAAADLQAELDDLDERRQSVAQSIDDVADLLAQLGRGGVASLTADLGSVLLYGRGWHLASDPAKMGAAFRESRAQAKAAGVAGQRPARPPRRSAGAAAGAGAQPFVVWVAANGIEDGRVAVLEALAGLERWRGFYDALADDVRSQLAVLRAQAQEAIETRRAVAAEMQRRVLEGGST
jgi:hypothetical protein